MSVQLKLMESEFVIDSEFPSTRYQGCKKKLVEWIWESISDLRFDSFCDLFSGTSAVGYFAKTRGKEVQSNDILRFNYQVALALIENASERLTDSEIMEIIEPDSSRDYPRFVEDNFADIYYTNDENKFLDMAISNISILENKYKRAIAYSALGQACLVKRPFNLFHRKNLYVRLADVERSFGNKATWEKPFQHYFKKFAAEYNRAVFDNKRMNSATNMDASDYTGYTDLVYLDTPYISQKGIGVDYHQFYHFLDGMIDYDHWADQIDFKSKHRRLKPKLSEWVDQNRIEKAFEILIERFKDRITVISYRSSGIPNVDTLRVLVASCHKNVRVIERKYKYVLSSKSDKENGEILIIGYD